MSLFVSIFKNLYHVLLVVTTLQKVLILPRFLKLLKASSRVVRVENRANTIVDVLFNYSLSRPQSSL